MRLDKFIAQEFSLSREKASMLIKKGKVKINTKVIFKPSFEVGDKGDVELQERFIFVSRAGEKLYNFLGDIRLDGKKIIDVGSSTGGFSQVCLLLGACEVHCVDVGDNQLDISLRQDSRIKVFEKCDIRDFKKQYDYDLLVCDLSFISIEKIFMSLKSLSKEMILLFKPQFEVGRNVKRNKKGVVMDNIAIENALKSFKKYLLLQEYEILKECKSTLKGKAGNEEFFFHIKRKD
ncbi:TlyA family RNA methyltransferase [Helicobacter sp. faydin-H20]|uniref:23S rRNA (cytidine-2'-O)-methyltransferase TlyA n=1 Tax=Helicobacter anatolicus TaxID=2905874 RepID=UPI001E2A8DA4|nr:TlyA family RNA methyltransferase [Helicobacter anatolicus]MCE3036689.1 TlyA family RNA methyltransferase [Helicobacter anatolicus]